MTIQIALRLPGELVADIDGLIKNGCFKNRTEVVRAALEDWVERSRRRQLDDAIVAGYTRQPAAPADPWVDAATRDLVADEPW